MTKLSLLSICFFLVLFANSQANLTFRKWAPSPPMGWNSWDCYGPTVRENEVKANADYMAAHLKEFGWEYIVVDIRWFVENTKSHGYNQTNPIYVIDSFGRYQPATNRFPSASNGQGFKALADYIHAAGLKFGIHIMRGVPKLAVEKKMLILGTNGTTADQIFSPKDQCEWLRDNYTIDASKPGAQEYYNSIFQLYASWGVDFIKIDDLSAPIYHEAEIKLIRNAIDRCGRQIVLSTSPGPTPVAAGPHVSTHANMWRMVNDLWDVWRDVTHLMEVAEDWYSYSSSGTWPDCDMIPLGRLSIRGERGDDRPSLLTHDEQYSLMTFFSIFRSPLMFGGDLPSLDSFTTSLLTNRSVLEMHANSKGTHSVFKKDHELVIFAKSEDDKINYVAAFNIQDSTSRSLSISLEDKGIRGTPKITDMWTGKPLKSNGRTVKLTLRPHGSVLMKIESTR